MSARIIFLPVAFFCRFFFYKFIIYTALLKSNIFFISSVYISRINIQIIKFSGSNRSLLLFRKFSFEEVFSVLLHFCFGLNEKLYGMETLTEYLKKSKKCWDFFAISDLCLSSDRNWEDILSSFLYQSIFLLKFLFLSRNSYQDSTL